MLVLSLLLACQSPPVALVPAVGDGLAVHELTPLDAAARRAFGARPGALDDVAVRARYDAARANGLLCSLTELECLVQVGVVVGAEQVALVRARAGTISLALVDVSTARWLRRVDAPMSADLDASMTAALAALDAAPPWSEQGTDATSPSTVVERPAALPLVALGIGGAVGVLGVAVVAVGAVPFVQASSAGEGLRALDEDPPEEGADRTLYAGDVPATRAAFDAGKQAWDDYGQALVAVGAAFVGVGAGVIVGALVAPTAPVDETSPRVTDTAATALANRR
jgi:hypothetical protein